MKKRLRKKRRVGEFREFGFEVQIRLVDDLEINCRDRFLNDFIMQAIETNG